MKTLKSIIDIKYTIWHSLQTVAWTSCCIAVYGKSIYLPFCRPSVAEWQKTKGFATATTC